MDSHVVAVTAFLCRFGALNRPGLAGCPRFLRSFCCCFSTVGALGSRVIHAGTGMPQACMRLATRFSWPASMHRGTAMAGALDMTH